MRVASYLARLDYASTPSSAWPAPAAWLSTWDAIARDVAAHLADEARASTAAQARAKRLERRAAGVHARLDAST